MHSGGSSFLKIKKKTGQKSVLMPFLEILTKKTRYFFGARFHFKFIKYERRRRH